MPPAITRVMVNVLLVTADKAIDRTVTIELVPGEAPVDVAAAAARIAADRVLDRLEGRDNRSPKEAA